MSELVVTFERIGRRHDVEPLRLPGHLDQDDVAEAVWDYARRFLGSREFEVNVRMAYGEGAVSIEYGRFGRGEIRRQEDPDPITGDSEPPA
jgi:hypothetical protein